MSKRILIIVFNTITMDVRVLRQIHSLKSSYDVTLLSFGGNPIEGITMMNLPRVKMGLVDKALGLLFLLSGMFQKAYWKIYNYRAWLSHDELENFDLIIANDIETLPLAFGLKGTQTKVLFDAHEFALKQFENDLRWRILFKKFNYYLSSSYIPEVDQMITQNQLFADDFEKEFGVKPRIMTNAPEYFELPVKPTIPTDIKIIHHGIFNATRKIDRLLEVIEYLPENYSLHLMLHVPSMSNEDSRQRFEDFKKEAKNHSRVHLLDPVAGHLVVETIHQFDIGVHILEPINYNHAYSLPNKILEFVQARLAAVIGPSPGMVDIVNRYGVGSIAEDFSPWAIAEAIKEMSVAEIDQYKHHSDKAANELSSRKNIEVLQESVTELAGV